MPSGGHIFRPPDPTGSPNEKFELPRKEKKLRKLREDLRNSGLAPDVAEKVADAFKNYEDMRYIDELNNAQHLEYWANIHTHPGMMGEGPPLSFLLVPFRLTTGSVGATGRWYWSSANSQNWSNLEENSSAGTPHCSFDGQYFAFSVGTGGSGGGRYNYYYIDKDTLVRVPQKLTDTTSNSDRARGMVYNYNTGRWHAAGDGEAFYTDLPLPSVGWNHNNTEGQDWPGRVSFGVTGSAGQSLGIAWDPQSGILFIPCIGALMFSSDDGLSWDNAGVYPGVPPSQASMGGGGAGLHAGHWLIANDPNTSFNNGYENGALFASSEGSSWTKVIDGPWMQHVISNGFVAVAVANQRHGFSTVIPAAFASAFVSEDALTWTSIHDQLISVALSSARFTNLNIVSISELNLYNVGWDGERWVIRGIAFGLDDADVEETISAIWYTDDPMGSSGWAVSDFAMGSTEGYARGVTW